MEKQQKVFDGNYKNFIPFLKQAETTIGSLQLKSGFGKKKKQSDISVVPLLGIYTELPAEDVDL
jgi:hypothetical protein